MKRIGCAGAIGLLVLLAACGGDSSKTMTPPATSEPPPAPVMTAVGLANGSAVTQAIDANGGTLSAAGITVTVPAGAFDATANVTLQPVTDTLNGTGQAIAVSSDLPMKGALTITFPIEARDVTPQGLKLARQQADGTWRILTRSNVDMASNTVSASDEVTASVSTSPASISERQRLLASPNAIAPIIFGKFTAAYLLPVQRSLKVGRSVNFVPYTLEFVGDPFSATNTSLVTRPYAVANLRDGFESIWSIEGVVGGGATLGTIRANADGGATYTAPATDPGKVLVVQFRSVRKPNFNGTGAEVAAAAQVTVFNGEFPQQYNANISVVGKDSAGNKFEGQLRLVLEQKQETRDEEFRFVESNYEGVASVRVTTTYAGCQPVAADVPVRVSLVTHKFIGDVTATEYAMGGNVDAYIAAIAQCETGPLEIQVVFDFLTQCDFLTFDPHKDTFQESSADLVSLAGRKTLTCDSANPAVTWDMDWALGASERPK
jgi:hypothetical protein